MFKLAEYRKLIRAAKTALTPNDKGDAFESLCRYLLEALDGVEVKFTNVVTDLEEIDIILWNARLEEVLKPWDFAILVECKNWSKPADKNQLESFIGKMRRRDSKTGMFIAANGVTGSFLRGEGNETGAVGLIVSALQEGIRVVVITLSEIESIRSVNDLREMIKMKYCGVIAHRIL
jgi:hypothetical protein